MPALPPLLSTVLPLITVGVVVALIAWALQLMQAANDRQEFSLMLAGCMVCSAAVGLAAVMVLTLTGPERSHGRVAVQQPGVSLDSISLPWDLPFDCLVDPRRCPTLPTS